MAVEKLTANVMADPNTRKAYISQSEFDATAGNWRKVREKVTVANAGKRLTVVVSGNA